MQKTKYRLYSTYGEQAQKLKRTRVVSILGVLIVFVFLFLPVGVYGQITVIPEIATTVELSSSDVNRIVCAEPIKDVIYSKEKPLTVRIVERNAFVKFLITKKSSLEADEEIYPTVPTEIYVVCGRNIYNIIAIPKRIPAQTVILKSETDKIKKNISLFGGLPLEKKIIAILKTIYIEDIPESFTVEQKGQKYNIFRDMDLELIRTIKIEGEGLLIKEFRAALKGDIPKIEIKERDFLRTELTLRTISIMVDKQSLSKGDTARIFIIEGVRDDAN